MPTSGGIIKHSIVISGHGTSISLEAEFWHEIKRLARQRGISMASLVAQVDSARAGTNLSSALRLHVLDSLRKAATTRQPESS